MTYEGKLKVLLKDSDEKNTKFVIKCDKNSNMGYVAPGHWCSCYTECQAIISKLSFYKLIYMPNIGKECLTIIHWH